MKRLLCLAALLCMTQGALFAGADPAAPSARLPEEVLAVSRFFPRPEGSPMEKDLVSWIEARLSSLGVAFTPFDFSRSDFQHSFSSCIRVDIPGAARDSLIVAVPLNSPPEAERGKDGSLNVALALDLIAQAKSRQPPVSLTVLFLGAEYGDTSAYPMGSTLFLKDFQPEYQAAVLYLNFRAVPSRVLVRGGGRGIVSPYWLMNRCVDALRAARIPFRLPGEEIQIFRMGTTNERTVIEPYLKAGYPSVGLEGENGDIAPLNESEWLLSFSSFLQGMMAENSTGIPEEWDRHYLLLQAGGISLIIGEKLHLSILLGTLAAALLYSLTFRRGLKKYQRMLARNIPLILPLAGLSFLFLAAGTYALQGILSLRGFSILWTYAPLEFLALKICIALFLYAALYNVMRRLPFPRSGSFYSAAALVFLLVDIGVVAVLNISFTYYFLWAFVFVFLSTLARGRYVKALLFLPAPFWGLRGLLTVFQAPALPFCHFLLLSPLWGNLLTAGVSLPIILMLLRLGLLFPGKGIMRRRVRELLFAGLLLAVGSVLAVHLATFSPFSVSRPQPLVATQTIRVAATGETESTSLDIESPAPLGALSISDSRGVRAIHPTGTAVRLALPLVASPLQIEQGSSEFLQQRNVQLRVQMPSSPRSVVVTLTSEDDFILYDSSYPPIRESPRQYRLLIGTFPPNPLPLQLTLPSDGTFTLTLTAEFDAPLIEAAVGARAETRVSTRLRVVRSLEVKT
jgi:hypothetical protein